MRREWLEKRPDSWAREDSTSPRAQRQSSALEDTGEPLAEGSRRAELPTTGKGGGRGPGHEERRADCSGLSLRSVGLPGAIHREGEDNHPAAVASCSSPLNRIVKWSTIPRAGSLVPPRNLITLKRRLQFFTEELEQLCADNAATGMIEAQLVATEEMYRRVDLLQEEYEAGLDGEEVKTAMAEWAEYRKGFRGITPVLLECRLRGGSAEAEGTLRPAIHRELRRMTRGDRRSRGGMDSVNPSATHMARPTWGASGRKSRRIS
ncbi:Arginine biosynthesis bifunctional protein ArgJ [Trichinella spiralis]|uniref:Arginine biosynthesis bifunctional protein ArgJ n=1 Tax=Trichinella spiralis TaxID=6334 RepID=A0ABR3K3M9_TRISP